MARVSGKLRQCSKTENPTTPPQCPRALLTSHFSPSLLAGTAAHEAQAVQSSLMKPDAAILVTEM